MLFDACLHAYVNEPDDSQCYVCFLHDDTERIVLEASIAYDRECLKRKSADRVSFLLRVVGGRNNGYTRCM